VANYIMIWAESGARRQIPGAGDPGPGLEEAGWRNEAIFGRLGLEAPEFVERTAVFAMGGVDACCRRARLVPRL
jgi:hypothetical protein